MSLKPIPEAKRMKAGLAVLRHLFEHSVELAEVYPTGTRFSPIGTDGEQLKVLVETPQGVDTVARIARAKLSSHAPKSEYAVSENRAAA